MEKLNGPDLQHVKNDLRVLRVVLVPAVVQGFAGPGQSHRGNKLEFETGLAKMMSQNPGADHTAKVHDSRIWDELLHGDETSLWADKAYINAGRADTFAGPEKFWGVMRKAPKGGALHADEEYINRLIAKVRSRVEHPFRVLKRQFGYIKTRYRGLSKNRAQLFSLFALGNLYLVRRKLMA